MKFLRPRQTVNHSRSAGVFGKHCELNSYGFEELSYMEFPSLDPNNNYIYIKFATLKENALLMYNHDNQTGDKAEFLALEILEGRMRFSFNLGSGTYKLMTTIRVSDGQFHTVIARRAGMVSPIDPSINLSESNLWIGCEYVLLCSHRFFFKLKCLLVVFYLCIFFRDISLNS